ncbi:MAG: DUF72 domain-containing protein [Sandaracinaceae bacterium]|nr:DUF72 domain-containing protein [Sandaracinaceae bacterium]
MTTSRYIGCSGFAGPPTRYWPLFTCVEITDTEIATPGDASVRRWLREAPKGYAFSVLAPREIAQTGFAEKGKDAPRLIEIAAVAKTLNADAIVFVAQPDFTPTAVHKARLKAFVEALPKGLPTAVFDLPAFSIDEAVDVVSSSGAMVATNPLSRPGKAAKDFVYHRLPGPAGHRSRYDEETLERVAKAVRESKARTTFCIMANIDSLANGATLAKLLR